MDDMRQRADWMQGIDDVLLEHVRDEGVGTPTILAEITDRSAGYMSERLRELHEYGLLDKYQRGVYTPNQNTVDYLNEQLDASELEPVSESE